MRYITSILTAALLFSCQHAFANITSEIDRLIEHMLPNANIGISITEASTGQVLYQHNAFKAYMPASNVKLFTGAAALIKLGPNFRYQTTIHANKQKIVEGTLNDDLVITFTGDPSLKIKHLNKLIKTVKQAGIHRINGNFIINNGRFEAPYYAPGWSIEDITWGYAAPVTSVIIEENFRL